MAPVTPLVLSLFALLHLSTSLATGPTRSRPLKANAARAVAMPTTTLTSDFQKNNVSAQWAPGHPLQWGTEAHKYVMPITPPDSSSLVGSVSPDEKFLAMNDITAAKIVDLDTGAVITKIPITQMNVEKIILSSAVGGQGYDLFVNIYNYTKNEPVGVESVLRYRLDTSGKQAGTPQIFPGSIGTADNESSFTPDGKKFKTSDNGTVYVYDLTSPNTTAQVFAGHTDRVVSASFSPDGNYLATAAWDAYFKLWDAKTAEVVFTNGPSTGQNWLAQFSPDGKYVVGSINAGYTLVFYEVANLNKTPIVMEGFRDWMRHVVWSPDMSLLALGTSGQLMIYDVTVSPWKMVQNWQMEDRRGWEVSDLQWLEGKKRLVYRATGGLEMYDFETNLKYRWGPGDLDHWYGGMWDQTWVLEKRGLIGGAEADGNVRLWSYTM